MTNIPQSKPDVTPAILSAPIYCILRTNFIRCPQCGFHQSAPVKVAYSDPFLTYIHECIECEYLIMESEWEIVTHPAFHIQRRTCLDDLYEAEQDPLNDFEYRNLCQTCEGSGQVAYCPPEVLCASCLGTGRVGVLNLSLDLGGAE